ncbi:MAG: ABC transporter substrate-binding protein [Desulfobacterales bacterium]|nr:ABC transporter substrate-binding protein [Desulfobacterales bacterium]
MVYENSSKQSHLIVMILVVLYFFCASSVSAAQTYKIGGIFSVTGPASFLGDPEKKSMEMAVETINKNGGIDGRLLEAVIYDTEGDPTKAVMAVSKLINKDKVIAIIGPSLTPTSLAIIPFAEKEGIPLISCAAGIKITQPVKPWVFKTAQSDVLAVAAVYQSMKNQNIRKIGILSVSNAFGESGKQQLQDQADQFGIKIVRAETFGAKDTDMTPQLAKIRKEEPDAIICWGTNPGPAVVTKNIQQLNIKVPLYQSHGVASPKFIELAGSAAEGIYLPTGKILVADLLPSMDPQKEVLMHYTKAFETKYQMTVSGFGGYAYDAIHILAKALEGSNGEREKIRTALEQMQNHVGVSGIFNFSKEDHNGLGPDAFVMVRIKNGTWELLK